jgi:hypothetical protein
MKMRLTKKGTSGKAKIKSHRLKLQNAQQYRFMERCNNIPLLGYHVETLSDGTKVFISKPGGKGLRDFQVWAVERGGKAWRPSHQRIRNDLIKKCKANARAGKSVIRALGEVYHGEQPKRALKGLSPCATQLPGLTPELILNAYKWIFGEEDCCYPPPIYQGRAMAWNGIRSLLKRKRF